jgi:hypothetical protein
MDVILIPLPLKNVPLGFLDGSLQKGWKFGLTIQQSIQLSFNCCYMVPSQLTVTLDLIEDLDPNFDPFRHDLIEISHIGPRSI